MSSNTGLPAGAYPLIRVECKLPLKLDALLIMHGLEAAWGLGAIKCGSVESRASLPREAGKQEQKKDSSSGYHSSGPERMLTPARVQDVGLASPGPTLNRVSELDAHRIAPWLGLTLAGAQ